MIEIENRSRITIMDGTVIEFATSFASRPGAFGPLHAAGGPFEVSASRNAVVVHRADLKSDADVDCFIAAVMAARAEAQRLSREDRGNYRRTGPSADPVQVPK